MHSAVCAFVPRVAGDGRKMASNTRDLDQKLQRLAKARWWWLNRHRCRTFALGLAAPGARQATMAGRHDCELLCMVGPVHVHAKFDMSRLPAFRNRFLPFA